MLDSACLSDREDPLDEALALVGLCAPGDAAPQDNERDRLRELRGSLPREVTVVAREHPLAGRVLAVAGRRVVGGVECLLVRLPDGSAGTVALGATSAGGDGPRAAGGTVLSVEGVRRLRALLGGRLGDGSDT